MEAAQCRKPCFQTWGPPGEGQPGCEPVVYICGTPGSFSEHLEVGVWNSKERSRLEIRFGVQIAFEGLE